LLRANVQLASYAGGFIKSEVPSTHSQQFDSGPYQQHLKKKVNIQHCKHIKYHATAYTEQYLMKNVWGVPA
jgi:hypothetical protein